MTQVELAHGQNLLVGIIHVVELIHEPCIAVGIGVLDGHRLSTLQGEDEVACVQHVQHRTDAVAVHLRHIAACLRHSLEDRLHLRTDILLNHLLITAQLGSMITANALMIV